jgi:hypothetical protein
VHSENALQKQLSGELNQPSELYAPLRFAVNTRESQNVIHQLFQPEMDEMNLRFIHSCDAR